MRIRRFLVPLFAAACWSIAGLALSRLLFEGFFPALAWLGRPAGAFGLAAAAGLLAWFITSRRQPMGSDGRAAFLSAWPLLLNLIWLVDPAVDPTGSRIWVGGTLWLAFVLFIHNRQWAGRRARLAGDEFAILRTRTSGFYRLRRTPFRSRGWLVAAALIPLYLATLGRTVGMADTFEFQVVAPRLGIVHPTGYPLYLLLGKLWTLLPVGSVAWRLNLGTAVFGVAAAAVLYFALLDLLESIGLPGPSGRISLPAMFAALAFALGPTFWSQAAEAEVYTLHLLFVATVVWLLVHLFAAPDRTGSGGSAGAKLPVPRLLALAFVLGLALTHHLTSVFLLPPAALALFLAHRLAVGRNRPSPLWEARSLGWRLAAALLLPLALYAYLPLRWQAVNGEPMGAGRFLDWIVGGRFSGALQPWAWWRDPTRYEVVGRLFAADWPAWILILALGGVLILFYRRWQLGLVFLVLWGGFAFYCLNYYVPDLSVFLLPAHLVVAVWLGVALAALFEGVRRLINRLLAALPAAGEESDPLSPELVLVLQSAVFVPLLLALPAAFAAVDRSGDDGRITWGRAVLAQPLPDGAAILADSEKFPPLFYLQQAEGVRPDLEIAVLPDEAAYRAAVDERLAAGQPVYLARFLPNLAGRYHLRSAGPLTEVSPAPLTSLPPDAAAGDLRAGPITLAGIRVERQAAVDPRQTAVTFFWRADGPADEALRVFVRWGGRPAVVAAGTHPGNDAYPTTAWRAGEIVPDYHLLPIPHHPPAALPLQVALAPAFTPPGELAWQTAATVDFADLAGLENLAPAGRQPLVRRQTRWLLGGTAVTAVAFPERVRSLDGFEARYSGPGGRAVETALEAAGSGAGDGAEEERYRVLASADGAPARCGWLQPESAACPAGEVWVRPLDIPAGAVNFGDQIALLGLEVPETTLTPGGQLAVEVTWQALAPMTHDYTVFVQVLDAGDQIAGQVDAHPLQGTYSTSRWRVGETVRDPYRIQLKPNLPPGEYRLIVGFYLLADGQRLPVLGADGSPIEDRHILPGLAVPAP